MLALNPENSEVIANCGSNGSEMNNVSSKSISKPKNTSNKFVNYITSTQKEILHIDKELIKISSKLK